MYARGPVWISALKLSAKHPIVGWGIGATKAVFPSLAHGKFEAEGAWCSLHNEFLQMLFEGGIIGFGLLVGYVMSLLNKCNGIMLLGVILVAYPLLFEFPIHEPCTALLIILFIAFIERNKYAIPS
jgi:O-antigen ligase